MKRFIMIGVILATLVMIKTGQTTECPYETPIPQPEKTGVCVPHFDYACDGDNRVINIAVRNQYDDGTCDDIATLYTIPKTKWEYLLDEVVPAGWTYIQVQKYFVWRVLKDAKIIPSDFSLGDVSFTCVNCG